VSSAELYIGLMSGTSLDGVDAVLADLAGARPRLLADFHLPFDAPLQRELLALNARCDNELERAALAGNALAQRYAQAVEAALAKATTPASAVRAIGCHGQTIRHRPELGFTTQIGNAALLAELTGLRVVADFRSRDVAAGGQGAPLAPAFHAALFGNAKEDRVALNLGGIANLSYLPRNGTVTGFDSGPGNCLLDAWIREHHRKPYDRDGRWAASGRVIPRLLSRLLAHPYFRRRPPKSTGREEFSLKWLRHRLRSNDRAVDVQATLNELTALTVARAVRQYCPRAREVFVCGGGARNLALFTRLAAMLPRTRVATTAVLGIEPEHVEALAFAWLARQALKREPGNLPAVTGARGARVLGAIYPK
jgi:anhydro-N-acetylmuramic acid kinase